LELLEIDDMSPEPEQSPEISDQTQEKNSKVANSTQYSKQVMGFEVRPLFYQAEAWKCFAEILKNVIVRSFLLISGLFHHVLWPFQ
jgi:hypothetical protein